MLRRPYAIVVGLDCITGLQTARILAGRGVPVIGVARDPAHFCCKTNACEQVIGAATGTEELIQALEVLGRTLDEKAVLVPCTDLSVMLISKNRDKLHNWFRFALPAEEVVDTLLDKVAFYTYAAKAGLPIPKTFFLCSRTDAEKAADALHYPCILKPPLKDARWQRNTTQKVFKLATRAAFLECYERSSSWADILMVQDWVEGADDTLYSCNCYFDEEGQPLVTFIARKIRQWPPETGTSCLGEEVRNDEVLEASLALFRGLNYHGLGYVEMKRDARTGKHYIIEPNIGRPTGRSAIAEWSGVDLLYTMYCDLTARALPENRVQKYQRTKWIYLRHDLQSAFYYWRRGRLSARDWLRSMRGVKKDAVLSWSDPKPGLADFGDSMMAVFTGRKRKKQDPEEQTLPAGSHRLSG